MNHPPRRAHYIASPSTRTHSAPMDASRPAPTARAKRSLLGDHSSLVDERVGGRGGRGGGDNTPPSQPAAKRKRGAASVLLYSRSRDYTPPTHTTHTSQFVRHVQKSNHLATIVGRGALANDGYAEERAQFACMNAAQLNAAHAALAWRPATAATAAATAAPAATSVVGATAGGTAPPAVAGAVTSHVVHTQWCERQGTLCSQLRQKLGNTNDTTFKRWRKKQKKQNRGTNMFPIILEKQNNRGSWFCVDCGFCLLHCGCSGTHGSGTVATPPPAAAALAAAATPGQQPIVVTSTTDRGRLAALCHFPHHVSILEHPFLSDAARRRGARAWWITVPDMTFDEATKSAYTVCGL